MINAKNNKEKKLILLAEDDKFISRAYADGLSRAGYEVITAYDGKEALDLAAKNKPDIILLDIIMPEKNGFDVLTEIKKGDKKDVPVIVLSNLGQESDIRKAKDLGAVDYMIKSNFSMSEVIEKISSYL